MHVRAHKDAFVTELYVKEGNTVTTGQKLLLLDSLEEDQRQERLEKMQKLRALAASEYDGDALKVALEILQFAIEVSESAALKQKALKERAVDLAKKGVGDVTDAYVKGFEYDGAKSQQGRATANLQKYNLTAQRFHDVNVVVQAYFDFEKSRIDLERQRLTVIAPVPGIVRLRAGVNSFMECGRTLLVIDTSNDHPSQ